MMLIGTAIGVPCSNCIRAPGPLDGTKPLTNICWTCKTNVRYPLFIEKVQDNANTRVE